MIRRKFKRWVGKCSTLDRMIQHDMDLDGGMLIGGYKKKGVAAEWGKRLWPPRQVEIEVIIREVK